MSEESAVRVSVVLTERELEEFDKAIRKYGRFVSRSDAIRHLIREFIDSMKDNDEKEAEVTV